ncbi:MAG: DUF4595 domain-containing protein [Bacteroidales bacterium]
MKKLLLLSGLAILLSACSTDSDFNERLHRGTITRIEVEAIGDGNMESYNLDFEYDGNGRISLLTWRDESDFEQIAIKYGNGTIAFDNENGTHYTAAVNNKLQVTQMTEAVFGRERTLDFTYSNNRLIATDAAESSSDLTKNRLLWGGQTGNLEGFKWMWGDDPKEVATREKSTMLYNTEAISKINLDINWALYCTEGLTFAAGDPLCNYVFGMQGYCGEKNNNFLTYLKEERSGTGTAAHTTHSYTFKYIFDAESRPVQIKRTREGASEITIYTLYYKY